MADALHLARVYDPPDTTVGARLLIDRLWPRGLSRADLALQGWLRRAAPGTELRRWYHAHPDRWSDFAARYRAELDAAPEAVQEVVDWCRAGPVTFLTAVRDPARSHAGLLRDYIARRLTDKGGDG